MFLISYKGGATMITPETNMQEDIVEEEFSDKTYQVDFINQKITGMIDGIESLKQSISFILNTERYENIMYSWNYGVEFQNLIGKDYDFILGELKRRIEEALLQDDRIIAIEDFEIKRKDADSILAIFSVKSNLQEATIPVEVEINV